MAHLRGVAARRSVRALSFQPVRARPYGAHMPLTLITGPANAAKAGAVLERLRAALPRDPVLVVPTAADATHYSRELAGAGIVFGADVTTFPWLMREIARAANIRTRPLGRLARERVIRAAIKDVELHALKASSAGPGFPLALGELFAELQRSLASPGRFGAAIRAWADAPPHARRAREALLRLPPPARGARDGGRRRPHAPRAERGARRLGRPPAVPVRLRRPAADPARPGRDAHPPHGHRGHGRAHVRAGPRRAGRHRRDLRDAQAARARARRARTALGALRAEDRGRAPPPRALALRAEPGRRSTPNGAVRLLEAGGERAEAELVGAEVLELLRDGMASEDIAVLVRSPPPTCSRRCSRATASRSPASGARRSRRRGSAPACSRSRAPRSRGTAMRRRHLAAHARQAHARLRDHRARRPARGPGPPPRGAHRARRALALGEARRPRADRARRARRRDAASNRSWLPCWPRRRRSGPRRTRAARTC